MSDNDCLMINNASCAVQKLSVIQAIRIFEEHAYSKAFYTKIASCTKA